MFSTSNSRTISLTGFALFTLMAASFVLAPPAQATNTSHSPNFGPNVYIFNPSMPLSQIQTTVDSIATQQVSNQFGTQRYALLFEPGTYGTSTNPLNFQVGYYTSVAGLGQSPGDVVINGSIDVYNQCTGSSCIALINFWRSLSNLTINVTQLELWLLRRRILGGVAGGATSSRPGQWAHHFYGLLHRALVCQRRFRC